MKSLVYLEVSLGIMLLGTIQMLCHFAASGTSVLLSPPFNVHIEEELGVCETH